MRTDAHVHMGYWPVGGELKYYSPRRVWGMLKRCGIEDFIVSSTSSQAEGVRTSDLIREAREMKRVAGGRAHIFCWITAAMYESDPHLSFLESGVYEGIKLHERQTPWVRERADDLKKILDWANVHHMPVQFHCSADGGCRPEDLALWAEQYPLVRFDFAHCRPAEEVAGVMQRLKNVYADIAFARREDVDYILDVAGTRRMMFGSDSPVLQICNGTGLTQGYRDLVQGARGLPGKNLDEAFYRFIGVG